MGTVDTTELAASLPVLESTLTTSKFVASEEHPTIADLFLLPELDQLGGDFHMGECLFDWSPYPNVERYVMDLIHVLPSYAQNKAVAVAIMNMAKASKVET
jgi:glutathione S-transferase